MLENLTFYQNKRNYQYKEIYTMFIFALIIPLFFGVFYLDNEEFFDTASEQIEDGYTWHYVGPTKPNPELPSVTLQVEGYHPFVLYLLKKDK